MCKFNYLALFPLIVSLASCSQPSALHTSVSQQVTSTIEASPYRTLVPTIIPTRMVKVTITPSATQPPATRTATQSLGTYFRYQTLEIAPALQAGVYPHDRLIIIRQGRDPSYIENFTNGITQAIPEDKNSISSSPNGKWLAYYHYSKPSGWDWLIVEDANGQLIKKLPFDKEWLYSNPKWLDNQNSGN